MSLIIAIKKDGVIYFGSDTQTTTGSFKKNQVIEDRFKVKKMPNDLVIGVVGTVYPSIYLRLHDEWFNLDKNEPLTKEFIVKNIVNPLYKELEKHDALTLDYEKKPTLDFSFIIAKKDQLYLVLSSGGVISIPNYAVIGSGEHYVYSYFYEKPFDDPQEMIRNALKLVSFFESSVSAPYIFLDTETLQYTIEGEY